MGRADTVNTPLSPYPSPSVSTQLSRPPHPAAPAPARGPGHGPGHDAVTAPAKALYRQLLRLGPLPATELTIRTGLTAGQVPGALHELADLGLIADTDGWTVPVPYVAAVDSLVAAQSRALGTALETVREAQRRLRVLLGEGAALGGDSAGTVLAGGALPGDDDASFDGAHTRPASDLAALHPGVRFSTQLLESSLKRAEAHLVDGVRLRVVHQRAALAHPRSVEYFRRVEQLGGQVRFRDNLPFRLMLIDGRAAVCRMMWQDGPEETLLLQGPHLLGLLGRLFETTWIEAVPLGDGRAVPQPTHMTEFEAAFEAAHINGTHLGTAPGITAGLSSQHQAIMRYLADGVTDQAIARFLGITTRTVTRRVNEIYQALGVQSRFQAGATARRMGLI
jgi:DNA-binding CsgD family transcriptional regulator